MKKKVNISLGISKEAAKAYQNQLLKKLGKKRSGELMKIIKDELHTIREHAKKDRWDLSYRLIYDNIIQAFVGNLDMYLICRILNSGFSLQNKHKKIDTGEFYITFGRRKRE